MCRSMVDIPSATAEIRRGIKKIETTGQKYNVRTYLLRRAAIISYSGWKDVTSGTQQEC